MSLEILVLGTCIGVGGGILLYMLRMFTQKVSLILVVIFPLVIFGAGFYLRLSGVERFIDMGFFFTEFSFLFVYIVFSLAFLLGQVMYWKKN